MVTIETLLTFSVTDLKRCGLLAYGGTRSGPIYWDNNGRRVASIHVRTDTTAGAVPVLTLKYTNNGAPVEQSTPLRFTPSNLNRGGFYYFVCPVTGRSCRKLYLIGGRFVSRFAFRALYEKQTQSHARRAGLYAVLTAARDLDALRRQPYRKYHYRGRPTPFARRVEATAARFQNAGELLRRQTEPTTTVRTTQDGRTIETTRVYL